MVPPQNGYPEICTVLPVDSWSGPFAESICEQALAALEAGQVLVLPQLAFAVEPGETDLLTPAAGNDSRKNISLDPATGALGGTTVQGEARTRLTGLMHRFATQAAELVHTLCPDYASALEQARTSFRPTEIAGRATSARHDDRRLHVDAFPTRPMQGRRILRLFCNIAPDGAPRLWRVGEPFAAFAAAFLPRVQRPVPGQAWAMARLGLTKGVRSRYDALMLGLHDAAKLDDAYQINCPAAFVSLPAGCTWLCFTDQVLHAAMQGHCALEQTFHLPVAAMRRPQQSPLKVLEGLTGRGLA